MIMALDPTLRCVKNISEDAYNSMLRARLAFLLDIDKDFDFESISGVPNVHSSKFSSHCTFNIEILNRLKFSETIFGANLTEEGRCSIIQLIEYIVKPQSMSFSCFCNF